MGTMKKILAIKKKVFCNHVLLTLIAAITLAVTPTHAQTNGSLQVTIEPAGAISNGAQWQVDSGTFQDSGTIVTNLAAGNHTLSFNTISNWVTPAAQTVTISNDAITMATGVYTQPTNSVPGSLTVTIEPAAAIGAGAAWQVDGGPEEATGATVTNLSPGTHTVSFVSIAGWGTPPDATVTITSGATTTYTGTYIEVINTLTGILTVTLEPEQAVSEGATWHIDGGPPLTNGAAITVVTGTHTVSFTPISGWYTPTNQKVSVASEQTTTATGLYVALAATGAAALLQTNGNGIIEHGPWPKLLIIGKKYTVTAIPRPGSLFSNWVGGTILPYSVLCTSPRYTFVMQSNLVLQANFVTNVFSSIKGSYRGLFGPALGPRSQTGSGAFSLEVSENGAASGTLSSSGETVGFAGKFDPAGVATIVSRLPGDAYPLTITLQLNFSNQSVSGTVTDGIFYSAVTGFRIVFGQKNKATAFAGKYTLIIPGTNNAAAGPMGDSYATVTVDVSGKVTMAGSLADGTAISQSSVVSKDGYWPLYINLYGGKGSLWGWNYFTNNTVTSAPTLSWINATNLSPRAIYRAGFFDQKATLTGNLYVPHNVNLLSGTVILQGGNLPATLTISNLADNTAGLVLKLNSTTGVITGSFINPDDAKRTIKLQGVLIQTNAQGYFLGTNESGVFTLDLP